MATPAPAPKLGTTSLAFVALMPSEHEEPLQLLASSMEVVV